jgi:hypothetical protein
MLVGLLGVLALFHSARLRQEGRHLLAAAAVALVVTLPLLLFYRANPTLYMERANVLGIFQNGWLAQEALRSGLDQSAIVAQQLWRAMLGFNATLDNSTAYGPPAPLLGWVTGVLWVLGFLLALSRGRQLRYAVLLIWVVVTVVFAGVLLENPPSSHRLLIALPALFLLAALALVEMGRMIGTLLFQPVATAVTTAEPSPNLVMRQLLRPLVAVAVGLALLDVAFYFGSYQAEHRFGDRNTEVAARMADYLNDLDDEAANEWTAYFYGPPAMYISFPTLSFLASQFQAGNTLFDIEQPGAPIPVASTARQVYLFLPERQGELAVVQQQFPNGRLQTFSGYYSDPLFLAYEVTP